MLYLTRHIKKRKGDYILKKVYILLSRTPSVPSKLIYFFSRKRYTHSSIAIEPATDKFCSYGRRRLNNVFVAGLIQEDTNGGLFKKFPDSPCELLMLEVSDESYVKIKELIKLHFDNYDKCTYKFSAFLTMPLHTKRELKLKLVCSQFVAKLLHESGACDLPRHPALMHPIDFMSIDNIKSVYVGKIKDLAFKDETKE